MDKTDQTQKLSPRQRECLRLVWRRMASKEIARELGISDHTVNDHLKEAKKLLGAASRFEAARMLIEYENPPQSLGAQPMGIPDRSKIVTYEEASDLGATLEAPEAGLAVQEDRVVFVTAPQPATITKPGLRLLTWGIERNDLSPYQRILYVMLLMVGIGITTGIGVVALLGITALLRAIHAGSTVTISF